MNKAKEKFTEIKGNCLYEVNPQGVVRNAKTKRVIKPMLSEAGYLRVGLRGKKFLLHRLVAINFIDNPNELLQVNHKNGIKTDNRVENLEWCSPSENIKHSYDLGLQKGRKGESHHLAKLKDYDVLEIKNLLSKGSKIREIAPMFNVSFATIWLIKAGRTWTHINKEAA